MSRLVLSKSKSHTFHNPLRISNTSPSMIVNLGPVSPTLAEASGTLITRSDLEHFKGAESSRSCY